MTPPPSPPPWLIPVLGVAGVLLLIVAWAVFLRDGGDATVVATTVEIDDVSVDTTAGPATTQPVTTDPPVVDVLAVGQITVSASSSLPGSYGPENLVDGVLETAWNHCGTSCEATGEARQGVGETIRFDFNAEVMLVGFRIANGYQKESESVGDVWIKNNRVRQVSIATAAGTETAEIGDDRGYQTIDIEPVTTDFLILEITQVYEGDGTYNDLGVSEIEVLVQIN